VVDQRRETIRFDPLEFVPGKNPDGPTTPRDPVEKRSLRTEVIASAEGFDVGRPRRPVSKTRPAAVRAEQVHDTPPRAGTDPADTPDVLDTPRSLPVPSTLSVGDPPTPTPGVPVAKPEPQSSVMVSPELLAPDKPEKIRAARAAPPPERSDFALTPVSGMPVFTPTPHGMQTVSVEPRSATVTWVLIAVGVACMVAAAVIAYIAFRPAPDPATHSGEVVEEAAPPEPARPAPRPDGLAPSPPAPVSAAGRDVDRSVLPEPIGPVNPKKVVKRPDLERSFREIDSQMVRLRERFPLEKMAKLMAAYGDLRDKRDLLLDQPAHSAELEAAARSFSKAIADTRRRLESP
jgi:hypothetical protein